MTRFVFDRFNPPAPSHSDSLPNPDDPASHSHLENLLRGAQSAADLRHTFAMLEIEAQHRLALYHSHFNPNQPRVPAGHPDGGRWTSAGGASDSGGGQVISDAIHENDWRPGAQCASSRRARGPAELEPSQAARLTVAMARARGAIARVHAIDPNWQPQTSVTQSAEGQIRDYEARAEQAEARLRELTGSQLPPLVPKQRPATSQERNTIARDVARWLAEKYGRVIEGPRWLEESEDSIKSYLDPPKTLEELQRGALTRKPGYDIHHIVEQTPGRQDNFPEQEIDGPANRVSIPRYKHWEISGWYGRPNDDFGGLSPREYLRGKSWDERLRVGLDALVKHGVLKP